MRTSIKQEGTTSAVAELLELNMSTPIICPKPLVLFDPDAKLCSGCTVFSVGQSNCAVPCPSIDFSNQEWFDFSLFCLIISLLSMPVSLVVLIEHAKEFDR